MHIQFKCVLDEPIDCNIYKMLTSGLLRYSYEFNLATFLGYWLNEKCYRGRFLETLNSKSGHFSTRPTSELDVCPSSATKIPGKTVPFRRKLHWHYQVLTTFSWELLTFFSKSRVPNRVGCLLTDFHQTDPCAVFQGQTRAMLLCNGYLKILIFFLNFLMAHKNGRRKR